MVAAPEPQERSTPRPAVVRAKKDRSHPELLTEVFFGPLGRILVRALIPLRVSPVAVVVANGVAGLLAAAALFRGELVACALLLQLKTLLDNADGQLARASGRTSALGRYLDTEVDLVANAVVLAALARETGSPYLALAGFLALTFLLSADFNVEVLYRRVHGRNVVTQPSAEGEGPVARLLERIYRVLYGPQDCLLQALSERRLGQALAGVTDGDVKRRATLAYHDGATLAVLANLGLSTQLALLGVCLVAGVPAAYLWLTIGLAVGLVPLLQLCRELRARQVVSASS